MNSKFYNVLILSETCCTAIMHFTQSLKSLFILRTWHDEIITGTYILSSHFIYFSEDSLKILKFIKTDFLFI